MRIGIDARFIGPKGSGLGRYTQKLLENLQVLDSTNFYSIFLKKENFDLFQVANPHFKKVLLEAPWYSVKEQFIFPIIANKEKLDLLHIPHFNIPVFYTGKMVVTIHDLIKSEFLSLSATTKNPFIYGVKHLMYEGVIRRACKKAERIFAPSEYIKGKLTSYLKVPEKKILVTYEGVETGVKSSNQEAGNVLKKFSIKNPYFIYVGNTYPYKNLDNLLKALKFLPNYQLVLVCPRDVFSKRLMKAISELQLEGRVILTGYVTDNELFELYSQSQAFVFPSLSEGFGLPNLEAMSLNIPVICSNIPVFKEIAQEAAFYFNPLDVKDIVLKMETISNNKTLREELIKKGRERVKNFSWLEMTKKTLEVYNSV